jgi:hypothetical protein
MKVPMTTLLVDEPVHASTSSAQWLRQIAAAVRVHFTWWGVHRSLTDQQKEEVGLACSADSRLLTAGKKLIDTRNETYRKLTSLRSRIANYWRGLTLPYVEAGVRLIRQDDIEAFVKNMEMHREELQMAGLELDAAYSQIRADAQRRLGKLFNPSDYPPHLRGLFGVEWDFPSVEPPNYLSRLNPALYEQEQQRVAQRFEEAVKLAEQAFLAEFGKLVEHLCERVSNDGDGTRKVFRDSVLENLVEFFDKFKKLNVRSNPELDQLVQRAQNLVQNVDAQDLRDNDGLRQQIATQFSQVQSVVDGMMVDRPRRRIIRNVQEP